MSKSSNHEIERRRTFRLDMEKELIDITWQDSNDRQLNKKVACLDFSKGGLRIDSDVAIDVETPVTIIFKLDSPQAQELAGKVVRCIEQETGWFEIAFQTEIKA